MNEDGHKYLIPVDSLDVDDDESVEVEEDREADISEVVEDYFNTADDFDNEQEAEFTDASRQRTATWQEQFDGQGNSYFVNSETGESRWEAPEWIEEFDEKTGAR
jgi:hypothetical protein